MQDGAGSRWNRKDLHPRFGDRQGIREPAAEVARNPTGSQPCSWSIARSLPHGIVLIQFEKRWCDMSTTKMGRDRPLLSVEEAGEVLGLSRATMYRSIRRGDLPLPLLRISGRWRVPRRALEKLINGETVTASGDGETVPIGS